METKPPISCYIRTLNEAHRIGPVIVAAQQVAREIVIVDSGSQDATREVAEHLGARVIVERTARYGQQKRVGEDACTHDWLLDIDADEIIPPDLAESIRALFIEDREPALSAYTLKMETQPPIGPLWKGFALSFRVKLYDKRRHRMPESAIWDQLELGSAPAPTITPGALIHYAFTDFASLTAKFNRASSARADNMKPRSMLQLRLRVLFAFPFYFLKHYIQRGLFRAGVYGFACAAISAHARWLRDVKMYETKLEKSLGRTRISDYRPDV